MNSPYANLESPSIIQKHAATCFSGKHKIQQLATPCRYHAPDKYFNDLTIITCYDCDRLDLPRAGIIVDPNLLCTDTAKRIV